jgi:hypothetical protein
VPTADGALILEAQRRKIAGVMSSMATSAPPIRRGVDQTDGQPVNTFAWVPYSARRHETRPLSSLCIPRGAPAYESRIPLALLRS